MAQVQQIYENYCAGIQANILIILKEGLVLTPIVTPEDVCKAFMSTKLFRWSG